jgi:NAD(P)-dependent dehydrogenase (short-subunit alcohol dehydrogenase family)
VLMQTKSVDPKRKFPKPGKKERSQKYPGIEEKMVTKPDYGKDSYQGSGRLSGKVALITGGDSGIGRAIAVAFAREGADIALAFLPEEAKDAEETIRVIEESGQEAYALPGDLDEPAYREKLIEQTVKEFEKIDILVNNAALQKYFKNLEEITAEDFEEIFRINVVAPFVLAQSAVPHMPQGGAIINTVSIQAYDPSALILPYAASKGALVALTKGLAEELLEKGIRVNAVAPGPIWSPLNTHGSPPEKLKKFGEKSAFGRPGQPIELAPVYVLLASDEASYISGEVYGVTGGKGIA